MRNSLCRCVYYHASWIRFLFDVFTEILGSARVSRTVLGVPPNTSFFFSLSAANFMKSEQKYTGEDAGRETRPAATGTVALPNPSNLARELAENIEAVVCCFHGCAQLNRIRDKYLRIF